MNVVRAIERGQSIHKSRSFSPNKKLHELPGRQARSAVTGYVAEEENEEEAQEVVVPKPRGNIPRSPANIGFTTSQNMSTVSPSPSGDEPRKQNKANADMELMKEKFAKLLLGEDMSGGGKGVSSALALSNAITNLAASVFGENHKLEPMNPERKARWRKEMDWLLSVTDHIVEFVPSQQVLKDGTKMEIMVTRQRTDLHMNIPALRKLDVMLLDCLDKFGNQNEFWYASSREDKSEKGKTGRKDDKWWLPTPEVPPEGLSDMTKKFLRNQKESVNQVLKASMAINAQVLAEMEIPESYIESLPKNGRSSLGDAVYKSITDEYFDPHQFLSAMDLTTEHKVLDLKNRIEASIIIWKRKMTSKDYKSSWGSSMTISSSVSSEKRELFEERAETILLLIKQRFPGLPQSSLEISKIQYSRDVGQAILESYSRVLESLASAVMSRIEDVLQADYVAQSSPMSESSRKPPLSPKTEENYLPVSPLEDADGGSAKGMSPASAASSKTLSEFMGWFDQEKADIKKHHSTGSLNIAPEEEAGKSMNKAGNAVTNKKLSYVEKLENRSGLRCPSARH